jgi:hypothetical protein
VLVESGDPKETPVPATRLGARQIKGWVAESRRYRFRVLPAERRLLSVARSDSERSQQVYPSDKQKQDSST